MREALSVKYLAVYERWLSTRDSGGPEKVKPHNNSLRKEQMRGIGGRAMTTDHQALVLNSYRYFLYSPHQHQLLLEMSTPKRSLDDHSPRSNTSQSANKPDEGAKKRAKDWRDAFLDDAPPSRYRERSRDRDRSRDPRRDDRGRGDRERDRNYDRSYRHSDGLDYDADRKTDRRDRDGPSDRHRDRDDRYHSSRSDRERPDRERETDRYGAKGHSTSTSSGSAYREHARRGEGATGPGGPAGSGGAGPYNRSGRQYGDTFSYADPSRTRPATSTSPSHPHAPATSSGNRAVGRGMSIAGRSRAPIGQNDDREEGECVSSLRVDS